MNWINLIAFRYFKSYKKDKFVNLTTKIAVFSIAFSIAVLIIATSVIRGFEESILEKVLQDQGHLIICDNGPYEAEEVLMKIPKNLKTAPIVETNAMIVIKNQIETIIVRGINGNDLQKINNFDQKNNIKPLITDKNLPKITIGFKLAKIFRLKIGDIVTLIIPTECEMPFDIMPEKTECVIEKIAKFALHDLNRYGIFLEIEEAKKILDIQNKVSKIICFDSDPYLALVSLPKLQKLLPEKTIYSWKDLNMTFADIMRIQRNMVTVILLALIFLAAITSCSALILFVNTKKREIGILRILGAKGKDIINIFLRIGVILAIISSVIGTICGILIAYNLDKIRLIVEKIFGIAFFDPDIYLLPAIPVSLNAIDIALIITTSFFIILFAALIPAYKTSSINILDH